MDAKWHEDRLRQAAIQTPEGFDFIKQVCFSSADYLAQLEAKLQNAEKLWDALLIERNEEVNKVQYWANAYDQAAQRIKELEAQLEKMQDLYSQASRVISNQAELIAELEANQ